jgi:Iodothyronine deiodinase
VLEENRRSQIALLDATTEHERAACAARARLAMPTVVDRMDNAVASAYGGWPDRLYLIGRDGRIAYQGGEGPFGFEPAELAAAIERELA